MLDRFSGPSRLTSQAMTDFIATSSSVSKEVSILSASSQSYRTWPAEFFASPGSAFLSSVSFSSLAWDVTKERADVGATRDREDEERRAEWRVFRSAMAARMKCLYGKRIYLWERKQAWCLYSISEVSETPVWFLSLPVRRLKSPENGRTASKFQERREAGRASCSQDEDEIRQGQTDWDSS